MQPFPNWFVLGPNIRYFLAHGVKGLFEEGAYCGPGGDLNELKDYVMARLMWDPTLDDKAVVAEFLAGYYGAAAPYVRQYMDVMVGEITATGYYMHENFPWTADFLTPIAVLSSATVSPPTCSSLIDMPAARHIHMHF